MCCGGEVIKKSLNPMWWVIRRPAIPLRPRALLATHYGNGWKIAYFTDILELPICQNLSVKGPWIHRNLCHDNRKLKYKINSLTYAIKSCAYCACYFIPALKRISCVSTSVILRLADLSNTTFLPQYQYPIFPKRPEQYLISLSISWRDLNNTQYQYQYSWRVLIIPNTNTNTLNGP